VEIACGLTDRMLRPANGKLGEVQGFRSATVARKKLVSSGDGAQSRRRRFG